MLNITLPMIQAKTLLFFMHGLALAIPSPCRWGNKLDRQRTARRFIDP